ncbi:MAG: ABC transporter substrate-binding protein [Alphaproteobacteria bacterium]|nr:ABC transporter substrate-binding protein [Alphaproteobacteria bacterium]
MKRRKFLTTAGVGLAAAPLAAPAIAQGVIRWRMASSFPKSLDTIYGAAEVLAKRVAEASGGKFEIRVFAGGEIVPGLQVLDAVQAGTVECGHTASYYYVGKDPTFAFDTAVPFGLNSRQQTAWMVSGGGMAAMAELFKNYNCVALPCGNTGCQMGGWFRKEIKEPGDFNGVKMRIGGYAGSVLVKLGLVPQQLAASDIYPALEKGTIDAAEWVGPYDDEKLGFNKVAPYYYYPGWWEGGPQLSALVNDKAWASLSAENKAIFTAASYEAHTYMQARYDAVNPAALRRLVAGGTKLRAFSPNVMKACLQAANEVYEETSAKNPLFKKIYTSWRTFRNNQVDWFKVAEFRFDSFMNTGGTAAMKKKS